MKHWLETRQVLDRLAALAHEGRAAALATVVRVRGSAYRREGAKLLVADDGQTIGNVSGGCLEEDVRDVAAQVLRSGRARLRTYCSTLDEVGAWDLGIGCEGQVDVFVEPALEPRPRERAQLDHDRPFAVCTLLEDEEPPRGRLLLTADGREGALGSPALDEAVAALAFPLIGDAASATHEIAGRRVFVDLLMPPPRLVIVGAGEDARPLARLGLEMGFRVAVVDWRPHLLAPERFAAGVELVRSHPANVLERLALDDRCYIVVMSHNFGADEEYVRRLVRAPSSYLGILGPRRRTERLLRTAEAEGPLDEDRIFGPAGLDIGTEGAEQVALSIVAELLAIHSGRRGSFLRDRCTPIHAGFT